MFQACDLLKVFRERAGLNAWTTGPAAPSPAGTQCWADSAKQGRHAPTHVSCGRFCVSSDTLHFLLLHTYLRSVFRKHLIYSCSFLSVRLIKYDMYE